MLTATERKNRSILKNLLLSNPGKYGYKDAYIPDKLDIDLFLEQNVHLWIPAKHLKKERHNDLVFSRAELKSKLIDRHRARAIIVKTKDVTIPNVEKPTKEKRTTRSLRDKRKEYTGFQSDLKVHEWILKYIPQFSWDEEYLEEYRNIDYDLVKNQLLQILKLMPRDTGKSVSDIGIYAKHIADADYKIGVVVAGRGMKNKIWTRILRTLRSKEVVDEYGHTVDWVNKSEGIIQSYKWSRDEEDAGLDFAFQIVTRGGELIGSHFDIIYFHDIIQEEFKSTESNESLIDWFENVIWYITHNIVATGTRKAVEDFYYTLKKKGFITKHKFAVKLLTGDYPEIKDIVWETYEDEVGETHRRAVDIDISRGTYWMLPCPNFKLKDLLIDRAVNLTAFEANRQNNPLSEVGQVFHKKNWILCEPMPITNFSKCWQSIDTQFGKSEKADNTCMVVFTYYNDIMYIIDGYYGKLTYDEIGEYAINFHLRYHTGQTKMLATYLHKDFAEVWLLANQFVKRIPNLHPITNRIDKMLRIKALTSPFNIQAIRIFNNLPFLNEAYKEYIQHDGKDSTATKKDDFLDALATGYLNTNEQLRGLSEILKTKAYKPIV